ncbi:MAG TPA: NADH-quinone oxidoreductase subunit C [Anaerolineales bacterium]|nr:NADH-quinone oxidoreductase subunit C [Anaerolineales bacterium]
MDLVDRAVEILRGKMKDAIPAVETFRGETAVVVRPEAIAEACRLLRDDPRLRFDFLAALTAVDYWPDEPRFAVVYELYSIPHRVFLRLRVPLSSTAAEVPTIEGVYPNANWHEREVFDMFGITFVGHSDLRRVLMPFDWVGHPLRKDYPLGYEEVQFSFNHEEIDRKKPYAQE